MVRKRAQPEPGQPSAAANDEVDGDDVDEVEVEDLATPGSDELDGTACAQATASADLWWYHTVQMGYPSYYNFPLCGLKSAGITSKLVTHLPCGVAARGAEAAGASAHSINRQGGWSTETRALFYTNDLAMQIIGALAGWPKACMIFSWIEEQQALVTEIAGKKFPELLCCLSIVILQDAVIIMKELAPRLRALMADAVDPSTTTVQVVGELVTLERGRWGITTPFSDFFYLSFFPLVPAIATFIAIATIILTSQQQAVAQEQLHAMERSFERHTELQRAVKRGTATILGALAANAGLQAQTARSRSSVLLSWRPSPERRPAPAGGEVAEEGDGDDQEEGNSDAPRVGDLRDWLEEGPRHHEAVPVLDSLLQGHQSEEGDDEGEDEEEEDENDEEEDQGEEEEEEEHDDGDEADDVEREKEKEVSEIREQVGASSSSATRFCSNRFHLPCADVAKKWKKKPCKQTAIGHRPSSASAESPLLLRVQLRRPCKVAQCPTIPPVGGWRGRLVFLEGLSGSGDWLAVFTLTSRLSFGPNVSESIAEEGSARSGSDRMMVGLLRKQHCKVGLGFASRDLVTGARVLTFRTIPRGGGGIFEKAKTVLVVRGTCIQKPGKENLRVPENARMPESDNFPITEVDRQIRRLSGDYQPSR
ncbi:hypothetical protein BDK51DRAFT_33835 [Blyttiomyces helicus]|uniref:Uncharacterized protein n=1 Tax=Blyttiomyces helicus TaxID=388810 RepID=A0A4P9WPS6_9FUNG|nr:hypothetical protein BDK51DRAFT_33835 [Blyttiomyces helicus]|eukprot:RKO94552.1 hypothetical protein BDK51DRAFT_33835 [Blyttiomyces helicus]